MDFNVRLKTLREEKGLTLEQVATEINKEYGTKLNKSTIARYESGECEPKFRIAAYFSKFYNVSLDYLIGLVEGKNEKYGTTEFSTSDSIVVTKNGDKLLIEVKKE